MDGFKVIFAQQAERDLNSIAAYISKHAGPATAERFGNQLIDKALTLANMPERGRVVPELRQPDIREIIFRSYRIVYRLRPDMVQVIRFWHAARGTPEISSDDFRAAGE